MGKGLLLLVVLYLNKVPFAVDANEIVYLRQPSFVVNVNAAIVGVVYIVQSADLWADLGKTDEVPLAWH